LDADPSTIALMDYEMKNNAAIKVLNDAGFNGEVFRKYAPRKAAVQIVTEPNTRARQNAIAGCKYSSQYFIVTNGDTLNTKDYFIAEERKRRQAQIKDLEAVKKNSKAISDLNSKALGLIEEFATKGKDAYKQEDAQGLPVTTLKVLCQWKLHKKPSGKKQELVDLWMNISRNVLPPLSWSDADETILKRLQEDDIKLIETALGRERLKLQQQSLACLMNMSEEERVASNLPNEVLNGIKEAASTAGAIPIAQV